jgi:basic membrane lipoprotein Med (substrate-binding protein (PBP1-ABC) superfamily)
MPYPGMIMIHRTQERAMKISAVKILVTGAVVALSLGAVSGTAEAVDKIKVGFIYVGPIGDHGWSYQHHQGLLALKKCLKAPMQSASSASWPSKGII